MAARNMFRELSRTSRTSSPQAEEYATASSFDVHGDDQVLHSTQIMNNDNNTNTGTLQPPNAYARSAEPSEDGSQDMSIELGRGMKKGARKIMDDDPSISLVGFSMGNGSDYEVTATPPRRPSPRKSEGKLGKDATKRRVSQVVQGEEVHKRAFSNARPRPLPLADVLAQQQGADDNSSLDSNDFPQPTSTFNARNTRFARARNPSVQALSVPRRGETGQQSQQQTPRRAATANATMQSDGQSWALPDTANIDRIIGKPKTGTPGPNSGKPRSRFASTSYRPQHAHLEGVPVPQDDKMIFASLQLLRDRYADLEEVQAETQQRVDEYETQVIDLQAQVKSEQRMRRPDSALGSDEETAQTKWKSEKNQLQAAVESLEQRLEQSNRKGAVNVNQLKNVTMERDELVLRCGQAEAENEELVAENDEFRQANGALQDVNEQLRERVASLERNNKDLKSIAAEYRVSEQDPQEEGENSKQRTRKSRDLRAAVAREDASGGRKQRRQSTTEQTGTMFRDMSLGQQTKHNVADAVDRQIEEAKAMRLATKAASSEKHRSGAGTGRLNRGSTSKRSISAPVESDASDVRTTTELEITARTQDQLRKQPPQSGERSAQGQDKPETTLLSSITNEAATIGHLRRTLESERTNSRHVRHASAPIRKSHQDDTVGSTKQQQRFAAPRKSSLRDITAGIDAGTGRLSMHEDDEAKIAKAVRIQSPHTSDASEPGQKVDDTSMLSNTSRHRRPVRSGNGDEGETSAFIIDDITMHHKAQQNETVQHDQATCTKCVPSTQTQTIPSPIPVTDRDLDDLTNNTIRPSQAPSAALAKVIKQLEDEVTHLKVQQQREYALYHQHDPAVSMRRRLQLRASMEKSTEEIEARSNQIYALYDVLEGQKAAGDLEGGKEARAEVNVDVDETLQSVGMDAAEIAGRVGRSAPVVGGLDGALDDGLSEEGELPWEGLSELEESDGE